jgi:hypothetical protein
VVIAPTIEPIATQIQALTQEEEPDGVSDALITSPEVRDAQLISDRPMLTNQFLEEPVTGAGNAGQFLGAGNSLFGIGQGAEPENRGDASGSGGIGVGRGVQGLGQDAQPQTGQQGTGQQGTGQPQGAGDVGLGRGLVTGGQEEPVEAVEEPNFGAGRGTLGRERREEDAVSQTGPRP